MYIKITEKQHYGSDQVTPRRTGERFEENSVYDKAPIEYSGCELIRVEAFATSLPKLLSSKDRSTALNLDLNKYIDELSAHNIINATDFRELDERGTTIWNLSSKLKGDDSTSAHLICLCTLHPSPSPVSSSNRCSASLRMLVPGPRSPICTRTRFK